MEIGVIKYVRECVDAKTGGCAECCGHKEDREWYNDFVEEAIGKEDRVDDLMVL